MPVETFAYIDSLDPSNPPGSDGLAQGDDHIRGIKTAVKNTFPSMTGATTVTPATLNALQANTHEFFVPVGTIADFFTIPSGWLELNGQAVSRTTYSRLFAIWTTTFGAGDGSTTFNLPNMADRYRRQRSAIYPVLSTPSWQVGTHGHTASASTSLSIVSDGTHSHGASTGTNSVDHNHSGTTGDDSPDHGHSYTDPGHAHTYNQINNNASFGTGSFGAPGTQSAVATSTVGTGITINGATARHQHGFTSGGANTAHSHSVSINADGAHSHAGSTAATTVAVANSPTQENMPYTFVVITCVKY